MPRSAQEPANALWLAMTTVGSAAQARELAQAAVQARLAACAQISAIESVYRWQGEVLQEAEWRVLFKTTARAWPALQAALAQWHPYELPAIVGWPLGRPCPLSPNGCRKKQPRQQRPRPSRSRAKPEFQAFRAAPRHPQPFPPLISQAERLFWLRLNPKRRRGNPAKQSPLAIQTAKMES